MSAAARARERCAACGAAALRPYLSVARVGGAEEGQAPAAAEELIPTTDRYGAAAADIVRCAVCGHGQVEEMPPAAALERAYGEAAGAAYLAEERGQRVTAARALRRIERHVPAGALCDLGCWVGFLVSEAERRGWEEAWGVEPSQYASSFARERLGARVVTGSIEGAELPEGSFQAVAMGDVIEHLPDPGAALARAGRLLVPRGVVYLALPDAGSALARALGARWWSVLPTHVHYFTRTSVAALLARHGFALEWLGTAPKAFSAGYYLERLRGYSPALAGAAVAAAGRLGVGEALVAPDFRDRMALVARYRG